MTTESDSVRVLTERHEKHLAIIVDQAKQIAELREELATERNAHANGLYRQQRNWDSDRAEGMAQVQRLADENQELRVQLHALRAAARTA